MPGFYCNKQRRKGVTLCDASTWSRALQVVNNKCLLLKCWNLGSVFTIKALQFFVTMWTSTILIAASEWWSWRLDICRLQVSVIFTLKVNRYEWHTHEYNRWAPNKKVSSPLSLVNTVCAQTQKFLQIKFTSKYSYKQECIINK